MDLDAGTSEHSCGAPGIPSIFWPTCSTGRVPRA